MDSVIARAEIRALFNKLERDYESEFDAWERPSPLLDCAGVAVQVEIAQSQPRFVVEIAIDENFPPGPGSRVLETLRRAIAVRGIFLNEFIATAVEREYLAPSEWKIEFVLSGAPCLTLDDLGLEAAYPVLEPGRMGFQCVLPGEKSLESVSDADAWF